MEKESLEKISEKGSALWLSSRASDNDEGNTTESQSVRQRQEVVGLTEFLSSEAKSILFIPNWRAASDLLAHRPSIDQSRCICIADSPSAVFAFDKNGIHYTVAEDYFDANESYYFTRALFPKIQDFLRIIDNELIAAIPQIREAGLMLGTYHMFPFVTVFNSLANTYYRITKVIDAVQPDRIGLFIQNPTQQRLVNAQEFLWDQEADLIRLILTSIDLDAEITFIRPMNVRHRSSNCTKKAWPLSGFVKNILTYTPWVRYIARMISKRRSVDLLYLLQRTLCSHRLILLNGGYDWDWCKAELLAKDYSIWGQFGDDLNGWLFRSRQSPHVMEFCRDIFAHLERRSDFRTCFQVEDIDFFPIVRQYLCIFFEQVVPAALYAYETSKEILKKKKIVGLLFAVSPNAISGAITHAARTVGIPVIGWQHGDFNAEDHPARCYNDLVYSDLFLTWGQGASQNRKYLGKKVSAKMHPVGSARLDRMRQPSFLAKQKAAAWKKLRLNRLRDGQKIIVYATTNYHLNNSYHPFFPAWSDNFFCDTQRQIVRGLAELPGIKIVKLHPNSFHVVPQLEAFCRQFESHEFMTVSTELAFDQLCAITDAVIIDVPTTTLLEALAFRKHIFCLTRHLRIEDEYERLLRRRAICHSSPDTLMKAVQVFVDEGTYDANVRDDAFLCLFGTLPDGSAAERAAELVDLMVSK